MGFNAEGSRRGRTLLSRKPRIAKIVPRNLGSRERWIINEEGKYLACCQFQKHSGFALTLIFRVLAVETCDLVVITNIPLIMLFGVSRVAYPRTSARCRASGVPRLNGSSAFAESRWA